MLSMYSENNKANIAQQMGIIDSRKLIFSIYDIEL